MGFDPIAAPSADLGDGLRHAGVLDLGRPPAPRADDVVVMSRGAWHVGVLPRREIKTLQNVELREQVERPEERRSADPQPSLPGDRLELGSSEMPVMAADKAGDGATRTGKSVAGKIEGMNDRIGLGHDAMVSMPSSHVESQSHLGRRHRPLGPPECGLGGRVPAAW